MHISNLWKSRFHFHSYNPVKRFYCFCLVLLLLLLETIFPIYSQFLLSGLSRPLRNESTEGGVGILISPRQEKKEKGLSFMIKKKSYPSNFFYRKTDPYIMDRKYLKTSLICDPFFSFHFSFLFFILQSLNTFGWTSLIFLWNGHCLAVTVTAFLFF